MNERIKSLVYEAEKYALNKANEHDGDEDYENTFEDDFQEKFAELLVAECADLVKARLNHIPVNQDDWDGHNYGETAAVYGILDTFQEHFGVDCDPENSKFGVEL